MDKRRHVVMVIGIAFICAMTFFFLNQKTANAQQCRIIRIHGDTTGHTAQAPDKAWLEPKTLFVDKGSCVIWLNWIRTNEIKIIFEEGKKCEDMTDAPVLFSLDAANCYVTTWVPLGGTSSLRFNEEGTFEYTIEVRGGTKAKGTILVR
jgi:hypothetical protein